MPGVKKNTGKAHDVISRLQWEFSYLHRRVPLSCETGNSSHVRSLLILRKGGVGAKLQGLPQLPLASRLPVSLLDYPLITENLRWLR